MNKKVKNGSIVGLVVALVVSVFANFHEPLIWGDPDLNQVDLSLNVENNEFQPIFISKNSGVTELINAKMECDEESDWELIEIKKILINTTKISGLLNHRIEAISVGADSAKVPIIYIKMKLGFSKQMHPNSISLGCEPARIQEAFCFNSNKTKEIITIVDFGLSTKIKKRIMEIMQGLKKIGPEVTETQSGSICNFNVVHEKD